MNVDTAQIEAVLESTLQYARERNYRGYDKADGMSSRILQRIPIDNKWLNIAFQEGAKRAPVNIRPLLLVEQRRNFKGCALFACANLTAWKLTGDDVYRREAEGLLDWLVENRSEGYEGFCGGHLHSVQTLEQTVQPATPGVVGTSYAVRALLRGASLDEKYGELATTAVDYVISDLDYHEVPSGARIKYKPDDSGNSFTLNANALGARLLLDIHRFTGEKRPKEAARKILDYVVDNQTVSGGWMYRDPPSASHVSMDNYHNGFIIESLIHYHDVTDETRYTEPVECGIDFYRSQLYEKDGAPNWDEGNRYPRDTHAGAQGIITFLEYGDRRFAGRILSWILENLFAGDGRFYYQKERYYTKRFTLMRWCEAWMAYALSKYRFDSGGSSIERIKE